MKIAAVLRDLMTVLSEWAFVLVFLICLLAFSECQYAYNSYQPNFVKRRLGATSPQPYPYSTTSGNWMMDLNSESQRFIQIFYLIISHA